MTPDPSAADSRAVGPAPPDFGGAFRLRGFIRRRLGLTVTRLRHPRVTFGPRCDIRTGAHLSVAHGATVTSGSGCVLDHGFTLEAVGEADGG